VIALNPVGHFQKTETKVEMENEGTLTLTMKSIATTSVLESSDAQYVVSSKTDMIFPINKPGAAQSRASKKSEFLEICLKGIGNAGGSNAGSEFALLEQKQESLRVRAGTFNCNYTKASMKGNSESVLNDMVMENWTSKLANGVVVTVKSIIHSTMVMGTESRKTVSTTELLEVRN
jgi:hypothetical protein